MIDNIKNWLRWASRQRMPGNRAADAETWIDAHQKEQWALEERLKVRDAQISRYQTTVAAYKIILHEVWADLDQTAKRAGGLGWNSQELRAVTLDKLTALYGPIGRRKGPDHVGR